MEICVCAGVSVWVCVGVCVWVCLWVCLWVCGCVYVRDRLTTNPLPSPPPTSTPPRWQSQGFLLNSLFLLLFIKRYYRNDLV